ncbi:hypothetical protein JOQ06_012732, partial [Pogonophryne albipinna]
MASTTQSALEGEAASYEFLKIMYITRKRTHGRTTLLPESKTFDLHYWISCFPFKEDTEMGNNYLTETPTPCHRYQAKLKSKAQKISKEFWTANKDLFEETSKPDLSYMSLVLDTQGSVSPSKIKKCKNKKSKMTRCKKLGTYIPKDKADMSPSDLLKTDKNILLVDQLMKTTFCLRTFSEWKLLTEKSPSLMEYLIPAEELKNTSNWFFKAVITTFLPSLCGNDDPDTEDSGRILFLCQCLYESQCPEACIDLLEQLDFILISCDSLPRQLWEIFLLSEGEMDYITLLGLDGNQLHLPVEGGRKLFGRAGTVLQKISKKVKICLHWEREDPDCHSLCETLLEALPYVSSL